MNIKTAALLATALSLLAGCSSMKVDSQRIGTYDFASAQTFQWIGAPAEILDEDDTYLSEDMQRALTAAFAARGWAEAGTPEASGLKVSYYIKLKEHQEYTTPAGEEERNFSGGLTFKKDGGKWAYEERQPDMTIYNVEVGTLHLTLADAQTGMAVWTGTLQTKLDRSRPIEKQRELFRQVAEKITARIPR